MRFPAIVLTCWTQLFCVACRILSFLLKLPYSGSVACISQLQALSCKLHSNSNKRLEPDDIIIVPLAVIAVTVVRNIDKFDSGSYV